MFASFYHSAHFFLAPNTILFSWCTIVYLFILAEKSTSSSIQGLLLSQCSGVTASGFGGWRYMVLELQTQVSFRQIKHLTLVLSLWSFKGLSFPIIYAALCWTNVLLSFFLFFLFLSASYFNSQFARGKSKAKSLHFIFRSQKLLVNYSSTHLFLYWMSNWICLKSWRESFLWTKIFSSWTLFKCIHTG